MGVAVAISLAALSVGCGVTRSGDGAQGKPWSRGLWVSRFDWLGGAPSDARAVESRIARVMDDAAEAHLTDIFFQVRGNGTAFYASRHELWSETFGFQFPGFDPLASAVREARARGLRLHAWINVFPGWRGDVQKADPRQLVRARPEWFLGAEGGGEPAPLESGYFWLDPTNASVRAHLVQVCRELVRNYDLDGIHLDHVRSPNGHARPEAVTAVVRDIRAMMLAERGGPELSAAVFADPALALERVGQDWESWAEQGLVDALVSMNYADDDTLFAERSRNAVAVSAGVPMVMGIGVHKLGGAHHTVQQAEAALQAGAVGVSLFSHKAVFEGAQSARDVARVLRRLE